MDTAQWIALAVAASAILTGPFSTAIVAYVIYRIRRAEKVEDDARQDAIATKTDEVARRLKRSTASTNGKLDVIHALVNSSLTTSMRSEYDAVRREMAMMIEVIGLKKASGLEPSVEVLAEVEATKTKAAELSSRLTERDAQQSKVDAQIKEGK